MGEAKDGSKAIAAQVALTPTSLPACCGCLLQQADTKMLTMHTAKKRKEKEKTTPVGINLMRSH